MDDHKDVVNLLIRNGADINAKDNVNSAPVLISDVVSLLLLLHDNELPYASY